MTNKNPVSTPAYLKIAKELKGRIGGGYYAPGTKLPSSKTLAEEYGVHQATIKNAFKHLNESGLVENLPGSGLIVKDNQMMPRKIALLIPEHYTDPAALLRGVQDAMPGAEIVTKLYRDINEQNEILSQKAGYTAWVIRPAGRDFTAISELKKRYIPLVLLENFPPNSQFWHVDSAASDAGDQAVYFLLDRFVEHLGIIAPDDYFGDQFIKGYTQAHGREHLGCWNRYISRQIGTESNGEMTIRLTQLPKHPVNRIIFATPADAIDGYLALQDLGEREISYYKLLCFGSFPAAKILRPEIDVLDRDYYELGSKAGALLLRQLALKPEERQSPQSDMATI